MHEERTFCPRVACGRGCAASRADRQRSRSSTWPPPFCAAHPPAVDKVVDTLTPPRREDAKTRPQTHHLKIVLVFVSGQEAVLCCRPVDCRCPVDVRVRSHTGSRCLPLVNRRLILVLFVIRYHPRTLDQVFPLFFCGMIFFPFFFLLLEIFTHFFIFYYNIKMLLDY